MANKGRKRERRVPPRKSDVVVAVAPKEPAVAPEEAANEEAVSAFLGERIGLTEISQVIETVMNDHSNQPAKDIQTILEADRQARLAALATIEEVACHKEAEEIS